MTNLVHHPIRIFFLLLLVSVIIYGCNGKSKKNQGISEGTITYEVNYFTSEKDNPIITLLPNKVELRFKENNISLISEGYLGFFSTKFISKYDENRSNILLKVLNNKLNYQFSDNEVAFIYNQIPPSEIEYLDSTRFIAGYECKMAKIYTGNSSSTLFYTSDINLKNPNRNTPLHEVPNVLLQFETVINNVKTSFIARKIENNEIPDNEFEIPTEYSKADLATLKKYIVDFK